MTGEFNVFRISPFDMREDPNATTYDLEKSAKYIIRLYWGDKEQLISLLPKHKKELSKYVDSYTGHDAIDTSYKENKDKEDGRDPSMYRYRLKEVHWKQAAIRKILIDIANLNFMEIHPSKEEKTIYMMNRANSIAVDAGEVAPYRIIEASRNI